MSGLDDGWLVLVVVVGLIEGGRSVVSSTTVLLIAWTFLLEATLSTNTSLPPPPPPPLLLLLLLLTSRYYVKQVGSGKFRSLLTAECKRKKPKPGVTQFTGEEISVEVQGEVRGDRIHSLSLGCHALILHA